MNHKQIPNVPKKPIYPNIKYSLVRNNEKLNITAIDKPAFASVLPAIQKLSAYLFGDYNKNVFANDDFGFEGVTLGYEAPYGFYLKLQAFDYEDGDEFELLVHSIKLDAKGLPQCEYGALRRGSKVKEWKTTGLRGDAAAVYPLVDGIITTLPKEMLNNLQTLSWRVDEAFYGRIDILRLLSKDKKSGCWYMELAEKTETEQKLQEELRRLNSVSAQSTTN